MTSVHRRKCAFCRGLILRTEHESITQFKDRRFCSVACANSGRVPPGMRRIKRFLAKLGRKPTP